MKQAAAIAVIVAMLIWPLLALVGCAQHPPVPIDRVTNQWWVLDENEVAFYLEQEAPTDRSGPLWYDYWWWEDPTFSDLSGDWVQIDDRRFQVEFAGTDVTVRAVPAGGGCYWLRVSVYAEDLACPW